MNLSKESFESIFSYNVYKKIVKETAIPHDKKISYEDFKEYISNLYNALLENNYSPKCPRNFLLLNKTKYVSRIIPLLNVEDELFYYFVCKYLEDEIAINRVQNTFGGWRLGNPLKQQEEEDKILLDYVFGSYNPSMWSENWKEFTLISAAFALSGNYSHVIKLDISNFYDSVNLYVLQSKLTKVTPKEKFWAIDYLMYFLKYWNKKIDDYKPRSVGLPQTEFGDQSRLLANFYLQDYDCIVREVCEKYGAEYVRYADDQLIFFNNNNLKEILLCINLELNKLGLNLNANKTKIISVEELSQYYLYQPQLLLDRENYNCATKHFFDIYNQNQEIRYDTFIKRLLSKEIGLDKLEKSLEMKIKSIIFTENFIMCCNDRTLDRIYLNCSEEEKEHFLNILEHLREKIIFNSYEYTLLLFYKKHLELTNKYNELKKELTTVKF